MPLILNAATPVGAVSRTVTSSGSIVIIDEVSMVGSNMLLGINKRLQQIKGVLPDMTFGGVSILTVGDLYQQWVKHNCSLLYMIVMLSCMVLAPCG